MKPTNYKLAPNGAVMGLAGDVWRLSFIPGTGNRHALQYQQWLDEGNEPEPADPVAEDDSATQEEINQAIIEALDGSPAKLDAIKAKRNT